MYVPEDRYFILTDDFFIKSDVEYVEGEILHTRVALK
jgi:hypothetical protein